jgi:hypothetical protein
MPPTCLRAGTPLRMARKGSRKGEGLSAKEMKQSKDCIKVYFASNSVEFPGQR